MEVDLGSVKREKLRGENFIEDGTKLADKGEGDLVTDDILTPRTVDAAQSVPMSELKLDTDSVISEGYFGNVVRGKYGDVELAVKTLELANIDPSIVKYIKREIKLLSALQHPNILPFYGISESDNTIYLLTEFVQLGDLHDTLQNEELTLSWPVRHKMALQLCRALAFLHEHNVIHRDLKPDNVLVDEKKNVKLADFGLARVLDETKKSAAELEEEKEKKERKQRRLSICGTESFMAPEVMLGEAYDELCDVFSYGLCLAQIITRKVPGDDYWCRETYAPDIEMEEFDEVLAEQEDATRPQKLVDLMKQCIEFASKDRPTFSKAEKELRTIRFT